MKDLVISAFAAIGIATTVFAFVFIADWAGRATNQIRLDHEALKQLQEHGPCTCKRRSALPPCCQN